MSASPITRGWGRHGGAHADRVREYICQLCGEDFEAAAFAKHCPGCRQQARRDRQEMYEAERAAARQAHQTLAHWEGRRFEVVEDPDPFGFARGARLNGVEVKLSLGDGHFTPGMRLKDRMSGELLRVIGPRLQTQRLIVLSGET